MGLFGKHKVSVVANNAVPDGNAVIGYLTDLQSKDYHKVIKIVNIYRKADREVAKIAPLEKMPDIKLSDVELPYLEDKPKKAKTKKAGKK